VFYRGWMNQKVANGTAGGKKRKKKSINVKNLINVILHLEK
jgi:hypothetical protein